MKKILFIIILLPFLCFSQTKKQTEDWIISIVNAYSSTYFQNIDKIEFSEGNLKLKKTTWGWRSDNDGPRYKTDETTEEVSFKLKDMSSVILWDDRSEWQVGKHIELTLRQGNSTFTIRFLVAVLDDNIKDRLSKAFEHLIILNGGNKIKDTF